MADDEQVIQGLPAAIVGDDEWSEWAYVTGKNGYAEYRDKDSVLIAVEDRPTVREVIEIWWTSNDGGDLGDEIGTELSLYAVVRFEDGRWGYVEAWNDYTGWGCQDGVEWRVTDTPAELEVLMTDEGRDHLKWRA